jgi:hypothetical protein
MIHQDKPDFVLQFPGRDVGLEFTEAKSQEEAATDAQAQHMGKSVWLFEDQFKKGIPLRSAAERRQVIENPPPGGPGWGDDRGVPEWVDWMMSVMEKKTQDLAKPAFDNHPENWLLVYDDLPIFPAQTTSNRWMALNARLHRCFAEKMHYGTVFIDSADELAEFASAGWTVQSIINLWKGRGL